MNTIPEAGSVWIHRNDDAVETTVAWSDSRSVLHDWSTAEYSSVRCHMNVESFLKSYKPKRHTITVAGVELPEPIRQALKDGEEYWFISTLESDGACRSTWEGDMFDTYLLKRGNAFRTKEEAQVWFGFEVKQRGGEL